MNNPLEGIAQVRRNFNHVFLEVPTTTVLVGSQRQLNKPAATTYRPPPIKTTVKHNPQQSTSAAIDTAYNKLISNFNQSVQPLVDLPRPHIKSQSTSKLRSIAKSVDSRGSAKLLPRLVNDPTTTKLSASFIVGKTRMHQQSEKKLSSYAKIASDHETPTDKSLLNDTTQRKTKKQPQTERRSVPRQSTEQKDTPSERPKLQYVHIGQEMTQISEVKVERKQLLEQLSGRMLAGFVLEINAGRANTRSTSYQHFKQVKSLQWEPIQHTISLLEKFCTRYMIAIAEVSYNSLMQLIQYKCPSNMQLLKSFNDWHRILATRNIVGSEYLNNHDAERLAATRIQSYFRMTRERTHYIKVRILIEKVRVIQLFWKRRYFQKQTKRRIYERNLQYLDQFGKLQDRFRQNWTVSRTKHRVEVHLHNIALDELSKLSIEKLQQKHNSHICRIFRAAQDGLVDIVCVTAFELPEEVRSYYYKILEMGGMGSCRDRVHFVAPQMAGRLPSTLSTSKLLSYSPKTLARIRKLVAGRPAYVMSSQPTSEDIQVSLQLNMPLFAGDPSKHRYFSTKCGSRSLFKRLQMPVLKGGYDIYNMEELINTLAILIYSNPRTLRWFLKIDNEIEGRGLAVVSINSFAAIRTFTRALNHTSIIAAEFTETEVIKAIAEELSADLEQRLKVCDKQAYSTSKSFLDAFLLRGGVVEAGAAPSENKVTSLAINFIIEPNGECTVVSSHEKLSQGHKTIGCICPCQKTCEVNVEHVARSLHRHLWHQQQMFGYFSVDLLVQHSQRNQEDQRIYFIGLDCYLNPLAGSLGCLQFLTNSRFDLENNEIKSNRRTFDELFSKDKLNQSMDSINTMLSAPTPAIINSSVVYVYIPFMLHEGLKECQLKTFFQNCRYANVSFDVQQRQGVVFTLPDVLQSLSLGMIATAGSYSQALKFGQNALDFLTKQYPWLEQSDRRDRLEVTTVKSKLTILLKRQEKSRKANEPQVEAGNISFLF